MDRKPAWAPGRDDAFNLPKYLINRSSWDETVANTDFPALWRLGERDGHLVHAAGEGKSVLGVVASSALGMGSLPGRAFDQHNRWTDAFIRSLEPPKFPAVLDGSLVGQGRDLFGRHCGACHDRKGPSMGKAIPLDEIGTDPEHVRTWTEEDADRFNAITRILGTADAEMRGAQGGYVARPLTGVWLLAPYLHNGSVPTLWDLLSPADARPKTFHRGYDVLDLERVGFAATTPEAAARGFRFDTGLKGNGNAGHVYGTDLSEPEKRALIEYLKTL
jgi:mono/diheme cytochrome c family protein